MRIGLRTYKALVFVKNVYLINSMTFKDKRRLYLSYNFSKQDQTFVQQRRICVRYSRSYIPGTSCRKSDRELSIRLSCISCTVGLSGRSDPTGSISGRRYRNRFEARNCSTEIPGRTSRKETSFRTCSTSGSCSGLAIFEW